MKKELNKKYPNLYQKLIDFNVFFVRLFARFLRIISDIYETIANPKIELKIIEIKIGWSIVIITAGTSNEILKKVIKSITEELSKTPFEIIVVGPPTLDAAAGRQGAGMAAAG